MLLLGAALDGVALSRTDDQRRGRGRGARHLALDRQLFHVCDVDRHEPRSVAAVGESVLDVVPASDEANEPIPGRAVLLAGDPEHAQVVLSKELNLARLRADPAIPRDDREASGSDSGNPVGIERPYGDLRDKVVPGVDDVPASYRENLAEAEGTLVHEQAETGGVRRHSVALLGCGLVGETPVELVPDRSLDGCRVEFVELRNRFD